MKFSAKARYGLKAMYVLAKNYGQESLSISQIAEATDIKAPFLEKVISMLKKGGFISSSRGVTGGYQLSYPPKYITIAQILSTIEEDLFTSECLSGKCKKCCPNKEVFQAINDNIFEVLSNLTLEAVLNQNTRSIV